MKYLLLVLLIFSSFSSNAQHQDKVDFIKAQIFLMPDAKQNSIWGQVTYDLAILADVDSVFIDAKNMNFSSVILDYDEAKYNYNNGKIVIFSNFKKGQEHAIILEYSTTPKQTVYFSGWDDGIENNEQVWTQGQGKYTSHWLPSFDDMQEKVEFDLSITFDDAYLVIANGQLTRTSREDPKSIMWSYNMQKPMSSYLLAFAIGNYKKQELKSTSGIPIENYYYPQDSLKVEPTYRYTKEIFDFLEEEIGVPYPWQNYKQIPVRDFLYSGMENTTATIFSDGFMIDSTAFIDKNYVNVNAHELAHQWFGNLVTEKNGNHHWLQEGFATYYAQLAEKEIFGDDHYYWKLHQSLKQLLNAIDRGEAKKLTDSKASSLVFYEKGAWALYMLKSKIGNKKFNRGIASYLKKYQYKNVTITQFLTEMEKASRTDLSAFRNDWLDNTGLPLEKAKEQLQNDSESIRALFALEESIKESQNDTLALTSYWQQTNSVQLRKYILEVYYNKLPEELLLEAFNSNRIPLRQVLAKRMDSIPKKLKAKFESLLKDDSYVTVENALFKLWAAFPIKKAGFLEQTKNIHGLPNKNVRLLWLILAIVTNDYDAKNTQVYYQELTGYTSEKHGWNIRMAAFQYLNQAIGLDNTSLKNLIQATTHHSWQFRKFARKLVDELLLDQDYKLRFIALSKELKEEKLRYLTTKLNQE